MSRLSPPTNDSREARRARLQHRGAGWCSRCGMPWGFVAYHVTYYSRHDGCFPLCELCWSELSPPERLPFYERLMDDWAADGATRAAVRAAVEAGL